MRNIIASKEKACPTKTCPLGAHCSPPPLQNIKNPHKLSYIPNFCPKEIIDSLIDGLGFSIDFFV